MLILSSPGGRLLSAVQLLPLVVERAGKEADRENKGAGNNNETPGRKWEMRTAETRGTWIGGPCGDIVVVAGGSWSGERMIFKSNFKTVLIWDKSCQAL